MPAISAYQDGLDVSRPDEMTAAEIEAYRREYTGSNKGLLDSFEFWLEFRPDVLKRHKARTPSGCSDTVARMCRTTSARALSADGPVRKIRFSALRLGFAVDTWMSRGATFHAARTSAPRTAT